MLQLALPASARGNSGQPVDYLAIGDSLAAGVNELNGLGRSYADFLAQGILEKELLESYNKGFAYPGYTTEKALSELKSDVTKPVVNLNGQQQEQASLRDAVRQAEIITISVGANDLLKYLSKDETGVPKIDIVGVQAGIKTVATNYAAILKEIKLLNQNAEIFIMGYYNPYPYLEGYQTELSYAVSTLDATVGQLAKASGAHFIPVANVIASDYKTYLPNPKNIHLSEEGYEAVRDEFLMPVLDYIMLTSLPEILPDFKDIENHPLRDYIEQAHYYSLMKGYGDGTFRPQNQLPRVQAASILTRVLDLEAKNSVPFYDMGKYNRVTQKEVAAAYEAGIIHGVGGNLFKPDDNISRAQLALMLHRAYEHASGEKYVPKKVATFTDISSYNEVYKDAISFVYDFKIAEGTGNGEFKPKEYVTRAQAAKMIVNFYKLLEK